MPANSSRFVSLLAVVITVAMIATWTVLPICAQTPVVHDMPSLGLPNGESFALKYGPSGGTFAVIAGDPHERIYVYDGSKWELCLKLSPRDLLVPTVNGELLLLNNGELYTYQWRFRAAPIRRSLGRIPANDFVAVAMRSTNAITSIQEVDGFEGSIALETGSGVYHCADGVCQRSTSHAVQLLGYWNDDFYIVEPEGQVHSLREPGQAMHTLPMTCRNPTPIGTDPQSGIIFRQDDEVWSLGLSESACFQLTSLGSCNRSETLMIVGEWLLRLRPGEAVEASELRSPLNWRSAHRTAHHRDKPARLPNGPILAYQTVDRVVVRTDVGVASIEPQPSSLLDLGIEQSLPSAIGTHAGALVIAQPAAVALLDYGLGKKLTELSRYPTFDNLMRNSVPTVLGSWGGRLVVGTSDARILALQPGEKPEELVNVREIGTAFSDLRAAGGRLWGVFDVASSKSAGLVSIDATGKTFLYGDSTGLQGGVSCVRASSSGAIFSASHAGDRPLHRYLTSQNLWVSLAGKIERDPYDSPITVHEIAVVSDSVIYLATSLGLYLWEGSRGYKRAPLSQELFRADVRSVIAASEGVWFVVEGRGAYFLTGTGLRAVEGSGHWPSANFRPRCLVEMPDGAVCVLDGGQVVRLDKPNLSNGLTFPGIAYANSNGRNYATFAAQTRPLIHHEGDSLFVFFGLPGDATSDLIASFTLDGIAVRPVRSAAGLAVFEPLSPGNYNLAVRVMAPHRGHSAAAFIQQIRVLRYWWTTPTGYLIVVVVVIGVFAAITYAHGIRQRRLAQALEALIVERTADLALAQRKVERASAAKSMFLANMSHEIRTPLNAVLGMTDLLLAGELRHEQVDYLQAIRRGGSTLHGIVGDILDFAEIDNGSVCRRDEVFELPLLLHELAERYAESAAEVGLDFGYRYDVPPVIKADAQKVRSIVSHLLANAVKFTKSGHVKLQSRYIAGNDETGSLVLRVTDTGIGICAADRDRIFEVFEQVDNSNTRRYGGTGLGLAIVKIYVECLGGTVEVESVPQSGTTFTVCLPVKSAPSIVPAPAVHHTGLGETPALNMLLCNRQDFFRPQLESLFGTAVCIEAAVTPKGRPDIYLPPAEKQDILCYVVRQLDGLVAFRQNPFTLSHRAGGRPIILLGLQRDLIALKLEAGEEAIPYPLEPGAESLLPKLWREVLQESLKTASQASNNATLAVSHASQLDLVKSNPAAADQTACNKLEATRHAATGTVSDASLANSCSRPALSGAPAVVSQALAVVLPPSPFFDLAAQSPLRILVAEDNAINKTLILGVLAKLGYRADWAENGRVAVERFAATPYDLILMDVHMPELDGLEATRLIRARFTERDVTICALTANASEDGRTDCLDAGMDEFMSKPLQVPRLIDTLRRVQPLAARMAARQTTTGPTSQVEAERSARETSNNSQVQS